MKANLKSGVKPDLTKSIKSSLSELIKTVNNMLITRHKTDKSTYDSKVVTDIIFNEKTRIVAAFKDYLILDDSSEFLRRFYNITESNTRLVKIISFYEAYSKIFPNYIIIPESKYLYKNIRRKQKMIDAYNQIKMEEEDNRKHCGLNLNNLLQRKKKSEKFFDTEIRQSILRYQPSYNYHNGSIMNHSILSNDKIHNNSVSVSLNLNKNIYENEESILSVENILNVMDRKVSSINTNSRTNSNLMNNLFGSEGLLRTETLSTVEEDGLNDPKKNLKSILADSISKMKNITGKYINVNIKEQQITTTNSNTNNTNTINSNSNNTKTTPINKPIMKKLPLKKLNLNKEHITISSPSNKNLQEKKVDSALLLNSPFTERKKTATHRVSSSIPELCNTLKIINNYPNIIIPNGSTHVSINQNYYNYGTCQSPFGTGTRIIMIEQMEGLTEREKGKINTEKDKEKENISLSPRKMQKTNTVSSTQTAKTMSTNNTNTVKNLNNKHSTQQLYTKVLKIFNDNKITPSNSNRKYTNPGSYKSIESMKKLKSTRLNTETNGDKTDKIKDNSSNLKSEVNTNNNVLNTCVNLQTKQSNEEMEVLETDRVDRVDRVDREVGTKSRLEMKEAYKKFVEQNKFECLTARNSMEKVNYTYKILNSDLTNTINNKLRGISGNKNTLTTTLSTVKSKINTNYNTNSKNYNYKKNLLLSPTNSNQEHLSTTPSLLTSRKPEIITPFNKNKMTTPVKFTNHKPKILKTEPAFREEAKEITKTKTIQSPINSSNKNPLKSTLQNPRAVKSIDFQNLKNFKK